MKFIRVIVFIFSLSITLSVFGQVQNPVGQRTFSFHDVKRDRKLVTEVWYPTSGVPAEDHNIPFVRIPTARDGAIAKGEFPVILFSHGTGGGRLTVEWLCAGLASHGFMVVAVDHFGNTFDNPIPIEFVKFWERPQDISFVLDQLTKEKEISPSMDMKRIGAAGFSLGGFTAVALAGAKMDYEALRNYFTTEKGKKEAEVPEMPGLLSFLGSNEVRESARKAPALVDKRIKSVFVMSPAIGQIFPGEENFREVTIPVFIVAAGKDQIAPLATNAAHYAAMIKTSTYNIVGPEAGHYVFLNEANDALKSHSSMFFQDAPGVERKKIHDEVLALALAHFKNGLK